MGRSAGARFARLRSACGLLMLSSGEFVAISTQGPRIAGLPGCGQSGIASCKLEISKLDPGESRPIMPLAKRFWEHEAGKALR